MSVRNEQELGPNFQKIMSRLLSNDNLVNLLYYTDKDPLHQPFLTVEQKEEEIFEELIKIIPKVGSKETAQSMIIIKIERGDAIQQNSEFEIIQFNVEVFVPFTQWLIKDKNLRPFAIISEIKKSLKDKTINGLGKIKGGNFKLNFLTEEISAYEMSFYITQYE